jgi:kynureninase
MDNWNARAEALQAHYKHFRVNDRILLTGHSHQAWPDVARAAQLDAFDDAAQWVDDKWDNAFAKADTLRQFYLDRLGDRHGEIVLGTNTQELLVRWLSALPLQAHAKIITTDGEFHSMRRLLDRLNETNIDVVKVASQPVATLADRLLAEVDSKTAAVMCSMVMFKTSEIVPHIDSLARQLRTQAIPLLLDAYHLVNVVPFSMDDHELHDVFVVGGGYKYCQFGEGNCFLRVPKQCDWRPVVTGWYAEFANLNQAPGQAVQYGTGRWAFEGSTYDPTSHYRAASVIEFFNQQGLNVDTLRAINQAQLRVLLRELHRYAWPQDIQLPDDNIEQRGGFLVLKTERAAALVSALRESNIFTDSRQNNLRIGPAPYITEAQLMAAVAELHRCATA